MGWTGKTVTDRKIRAERDVLAAALEVEFAFGEYRPIGHTVIPEPHLDADGYKNYSLWVNGYPTWGDFDGTTQLYPLNLLVCANWGTGDVMVKSIGVSDTLHNIPSRSSDFFKSLPKRFAPSHPAAEELNGWLDSLREEEKNKRAAARARAKFTGIGARVRFASAMKLTSGKTVDWVEVVQRTDARGRKRTFFTADGVPGLIRCPKGWRNSVVESIPSPGAEPVTF